jgi:peptidoglycan/xylan/chitin deacetylase (PgdA/CDA1 family)
MLATDTLRIRERLINLAGDLSLPLNRKTNSSKGELTVLDYHRISAKTLRRHLDYIQSHYHIVSPQAFLEWLENKIVIDEPSVVFSFDDAYFSFYKEIYPVLRERELSVFMFVPTGYIGTSNFLWEDELEAAFRKTNVRSILIDGRKFCLLWGLYRTDFYDGIFRYLRSLDRETRNEQTKEIFAQLQVSVSEEDMVPYRFLGWPEILEMERSGLVVFGSHTVSHPNLSLLTDDALRSELEESKEALESRTGGPIGTFAYPYGDQASFNGRVIGELAKAGYVCAFTTIQGKVDKKRTDPFAVNRTLLFDYQNQGSLALKLRWF